MHPVNQIRRIALSLLPTGVGEFLKRKFGKAAISSEERFDLLDLSVSECFHRLAYLKSRIGGLDRVETDAGGLAAEVDALTRQMNELSIEVSNIRNMQDWLVADYGQFKIDFENFKASCTRR